jgi:hypothetical protein
MSQNGILLGGEIGDAIYALPTIKALGGGDVYAKECPWTRPNWVRRAESLKTLFEEQDYIGAFGPHTGQPANIDLTTYRANGQRFGDLIVNRIARHAGVKIDITEPWLKVEPSKETAGRIIVNRAPRWIGLTFPWQAVVKEFQKEILFVGSEAEHKAFTSEFGYVGRLRCKDMLAVASAIAGCDTFIGAQSSPYAICEGLKHKAVLEVCPTALDCTFFRDDLVHYVCGELSFTALGRDFAAPAAPTKNMLGGKGYRIEVAGQEISSWEYFEVEAIARAQFVLSGIQPPSIWDLRAMIAEQSKKPIPQQYQKAA